MRWLFLSPFLPLNGSIIFEIAGAVVKIGSSLKPNHSKMTMFHFVKLVLISVKNTRNRNQGRKINLPPCRTCCNWCQADVFLATIDADGNLANCRRELDGTEVKLIPGDFDWLEAGNSSSTRPSISGCEKSSCRSEYSVELPQKCPIRDFPNVMSSIGRQLMTSRPLTKTVHYDRRCSSSPPRCHRLNSYSDHFQAHSIRLSFRCNPQTCCYALKRKSFLQLWRQSIFWRGERQGAKDGVQNVENCDANLVTIRLIRQFINEDFITWPWPTCHSSLSVPCTVARSSEAQLPSSPSGPSCEEESLQSESAQESIFIRCILWNVYFWVLEHSDLFF